MRLTITSAVTLLGALPGLASAAPSEQNAPAQDVCDGSEPTVVVHPVYISTEVPYSTHLTFYDQITVSAPGPTKISMYTQVTSTVTPSYSYSHSDGPASSASAWSSAEPVYSSQKPSIASAYSSPSSHEASSPSSHEASSPSSHEASTSAPVYSAPAYSSHSYPPVSTYSTPSVSKVDPVSTTAPSTHSYYSQPSFLSTSYSTASHSAPTYSHEEPTASVAPTWTTVAVPSSAYSAAPTPKPSAAAPTYDAPAGWQYHGCSARHGSQSRAAASHQVCAEVCSDETYFAYGASECSCWTDDADDDLFLGIDLGADSCDGLNLAVYAQA